MSRTTIDIDPSILKEMKALAQKRGRTLGETVSVLLAEALAEVNKASEQPPFRWISKHMGPALVDLQDKAAVWRIIDADYHDDEEDGDAHYH
jgi:macrodomain Ter protein organizer (MatP/YcbG family)